MTQVIIDNLDLWSSALQSLNSGRVGNGSKNAYGINKLRELVYELAVRGKLVPQDPSDEPARALLERIATSKAPLVAAGQVRQAEPLPPISEKEKRFELPEGWEWIRFGNIFKLEYGNNLPEAKRTNTGEYAVYGSNGIVGSHDSYCVDGPCIVVGRKGSAGALNLCLDSRCWVTDVAYSVIPPPEVDLEFVFKLFHTLGLDSLGKGIKPGLNRNEAYVLPVAIPPLNEQHRIVAKVNELLVLCDQLEQQQTHGFEAHQFLVDNLLLTLTRAASPQEFAEDWTRIANNFDTLFCTDKSVDQLKQTIVQLAVMGKLVPQDPNEESASQLLERIAKEKEKLVEEAGMGKTKQYAEITAEETLFETPSGWQWVRLDTLFNVIVDCPHSTPKFAANGFLCLDTNSFKRGALITSKFRYVDADTYSERIARLTPAEGDIVFAREGSVGESVVLPAGLQCCLGQRVMLLRPSKLLNSEFLRLAISSPLSLDALLELHKGIGAKHVNVGDMRKFAIALPPAAEQLRIVAKVEQLMALCEAIKLALADAQTTQIHLADAVVEQSVA